MVQIQRNMPQCSYQKRLLNSRSLLPPQAVPLPRGGRLEQLLPPTAVRSVPLPRGGRLGQLRPPTATRSVPLPRGGRLRHYPQDDFACPKGKLSSSPRDNKKMLRFSEHFFVFDEVEIISWSFDYLFLYITSSGFSPFSS